MRSFYKFFYSPTKIVRPIEDSDYVPYIKETCENILKIVNHKLDDDDIENVVNCILDYLRASGEYYTCFGSFCECLINTARDIGTFSGSRVMEFTKGMFVLEKTWHLLVGTINNEISNNLLYSSYKKIDEPRSIIVVAFNYIKNLSLLDKIKIFYNILF